MNNTTDFFPSYVRGYGVQASGVTVTADALSAVNNLSGLTVTAGQINYATSFPASAAYAVSAGYSASAGSVGLTTAMWNDIIMPGANLGAGVSVPDLVTLTDNIMVRGFNGTATMEQLFGTFEMEHDYKEGTDLRPHIHWCPSTTHTGDAVWNLEYSYSATGGVFSTATTITATGTASGVANTHLKKEFSVIAGSGISVGDILCFRLYRDPATAADTYSADALLLNLGIHYQSSSIGRINISGN